MLKEKIDNFRQPKFTNRKRDAESYKNIHAYVINDLRRLAKAYHKVTHDEDTLKLIREDVDHVLRRFHKYCIKERIGAHYIEVGVEDGIFEHMVPNSVTRDLLLYDVISVHDACAMPTCLLSAESDALLREKGWSSQTPDIYYFWKRYEYCFEVEDRFTTWDGTPVDPAQTLDDHFWKFPSLSSLV